MADSTLRDDAELRALRRTAQGYLGQYAGRVYPLTGAWSDGTTCRFGVKDPNKDGTGKGFTRLQADPVPASLRLVKIQPGDPVPVLGASIGHEQGTLVLGLWSDESVYTGQRVGVCRLVDARAYPIGATRQNGTTFHLRVEANRTAAASVSSSNDLQLRAGASHTGHLPPGLHLDPGEVIRDTDGVAYLVIQPIGWDVLGDTVGLSWGGTEGYFG